MLNYSKKALDNKEIYYKYHRLIKFKDDKYEVKTLNDLFHKLFNNRTSNATIYVDNEFHHCGINRGRSYIDCWLLCKYYLPNVTYYEMYHELRNLVQLSNYAHFSVCPTIGRNRFNGLLNIK